MYMSQYSLLISFSEHVERCSLFLLLWHLLLLYSSEIKWTLSLHLSHLLLWHRTKLVCLWSTHHATSIRLLLHLCSILSLHSSHSIQSLIILISYRRLCLLIILLLHHLLLLHLHSILLLWVLWHAGLEHWIWYEFRLLSLLLVLLGQWARFDGAVV